MIKQRLSFTAAAAAAVLAAGAVFGGAKLLAPETAGAQSQAPAPAAAMNADGTASAIFAGGCFWCVESDFDKIPGVVATISGYAGGNTMNPTYKQVTRGGTGHYEVVKIDYNPNQVSYDQLLTAFWHSTNPTDPGGQFCDRGHSYKTAVIALDQRQASIAQSQKAQLIADGKPIVTPVLPAAAFYAAEDYHQDYYQKNPIRYNYYRRSCGRNKTVKQVWGEDAYKGIPGKQKGSS